jgi:putative transposase
MPRALVRRRYPSDLTDAQWALLEAAMPPAVHGRTGRPRTYPLREVWNAVFYLARNGGSWRALPHDFPPWEVVWDHFRRWRRNGTLVRVHDLLREEVRVWAGKTRTPSAVVLDSQSVATTEKGGPRATTPARRSRGASASWSSTRSA